MTINDMENAMQEIVGLVNGVYTGSEDEHRETLQAIMDICKRELDDCSGGHHDWVADDYTRHKHHCHCCGALGGQNDD